MAKAKTKSVSIRKPMLSSADVLNFAQPTKRSAAPSQPDGQRSGLVPQGDRRLTANISEDLHKKLKHAAVDQGVTVGELIEDMIRKHL